MKKILIVATAALCFTSSSFAVETAGGLKATTKATGTITAPVIIKASAAIGMLGALVANNRGNAKAEIVVPPVDPTCNGSDPLVDGVCTGTSTTVTVSGTGTGTGTTTLTVPVTFTYLPTT